MDRNAPESLLLGADAALEAVEALQTAGTDMTIAWSSVLPRDGRVVLSGPHEEGWHSLDSATYPFKLTFQKTRPNWMLCESCSPTVPTILRCTNPWGWSVTEASLPIVSI